MSRRALLLANRNARQTNSLLDQAVQELRQFGFELTQQFPEKPSQFGELIGRHRDQADFIILAGGDGTLNAALDGLVEAGLPLAILPTGTANDLARTLGVPTDLSKACQVISEGHTKSIDLGWVNDKHFLNVASLGLTVKITQQLTRELKSRWGLLAYLVTAARVILQARPKAAVVRAGDEVHRVKTVQVTVGNGRHYGGGLTVAEDAAIDDGLLDLFSLEIDHWWQIIPLLPAMRRGDLAGSTFVRTLRGKEFSIETRRPSRISADGELLTRTPAVFRVVPQAIRVFVPRAEQVSETT